MKLNKTICEQCKLSFCNYRNTHTTNNGRQIFLKLLLTSKDRPKKKKIRRLENFHVKSRQLKYVFFCCNYCFLFLFKYVFRDVKKIEPIYFDVYRYGLLMKMCNKKMKENQLPVLA